TRYKEEEIINIASTKVVGHTVILGFGEFGQNIAKSLKDDGQLYIAIDNNIELYHRARSMGESIVFGNATNKAILKSINISQAQNVIVAIDNPKKLYVVCETLKKYVDIHKIIVKIHTSSQREELAELGIQNIVIENELASNSVSELISNNTRI
ncbi:MAG: NAD(P)-binding protein, partial [Arcobacteraceae bacterium]